MEEKVLELEKRLEKLERIENRRKSIVIIKIVGILLLIVIIIVSGLILFKKIEQTIKPYKEFIEKQNDFKKNVDTSIDSIKDLFN